MSADMDRSDDQLLTALNSPDAELSAEAARRIKLVFPWRLSRLVKRAALMEVETARRFVGVAFISLGAVIAMVAIGDKLTAPIVLCMVVIGIVALVRGALTARETPQRNMARCFERLALHIGSLTGTETLTAAASLLVPAPGPFLPIVLRRALQSHIRRLLPLVTGAEFAEARASLVWILRTPHEDTELTETLIDTLVRLADPFDLDLRSRLAGLAARTSATPQMALLRTAAARALTQLAERRDAQVLAQSLVRASQGPDCADALLRAASASATPVGEMLRPAAADPDAPLEPDRVNCRHGQRTR